MDDPIDYEAVLADLRARRTQLDVVIAGIEAFNAGTTLSNDEVLMDESGDTANSSNGRMPKGLEIQNDTFFGMTTPAAVQRFLAMQKRPQSPKAVAAAMLEGGQVQAVNEKTAYTNAYTALRRLAESGKVVQIKTGEWGLAEWYNLSKNDE